MTASSHIKRALLSMAFLLSILASPSLAAKHIALVIGNSNYEAVSPLINPKNDSEDVAAALKKLGFEVLLHQNLNYEGMRRALREFSRKSIGAERAMLFYAGHGIEVEGTNYLIPTDAQLRNDLDVQYEAIPLDSGLTAVEGANELRLVILDACRNNPFVNKIKRTSATRSIGRGLARIEPAVGTLVGFAAKEGTTADDGEGRNSPYTAALLQNLDKPGLELNFLFRNVRDTVYQSTQGRQQPFTYGSLPSKRIFLNPLKLKEPQEQKAAPVVQNAPAPKPSPSSADQLAAELLYWNTVKDSRDPDILQSYLNDYPGGKFSGLAKVLIAKLKAETQTPAKLAAAQMATSAERTASKQPEPKPSTPASKPLAAEPQPAEPAPARVAALPPDTPVEDRSAIRQMQSKLHELNYDPGPADGMMGSRTTNAIRAFERENGLKIAGRPTIGVLEAIRNKPVPSQWGALGFSPANKRIVRVSKLASRSGAERGIKGECSSCSQVLTYAGGNCGAIALSSRGWGWAVRSSLSDARQAATNICAQYGSGCEIKSAGCANGS